MSKAQGQLLTLPYRMKQTTNHRITQLVHYCTDYPTNQVTNHYQQSPLRDITYAISEQCSKWSVVTGFCIKILLQVVVFRVVTPLY